MQLKESKTNWHFITSIMKSGLRFGACFALFNEEFGFAAIWFAIAEILGIVEEF